MFCTWCVLYKAFGLYFVHSTIFPLSRLLRTTKIKALLSWNSFTFCFTSLHLLNPEIIKASELYGRQERLLLPVVIKPVDLLWCLTCTTLLHSSLFMFQYTVKIYQSLCLSLSPVQWCHLLSSSMVKRLYPGASQTSPSLFPGTWVSCSAPGSLLVLWCRPMLDPPLPSISWWETGHGTLLCTCRSCKSSLSGTFYFWNSDLWCINRSRMSWHYFSMFSI